MKINNYLIIRNDGVGDLILSLPLIKELKEKKGSLIYLVCSSRNIEFAMHLKEIGLIEQVVYLDKNEKSKKDYYLHVTRLLRNKSFEAIYILKPSITNLLISLSLKKKNIFSIIAINESKIFKIRKYSPPIFSSLLLKKYELIDCRNNYMNSTKIHMSKHYANLYNATNSKKMKSNLKSIMKTNFLNYESAAYIKKIKKIINYNIKKNIVMLHFDEKWNRSYQNEDEIKIFLKSLFKIKNSTIIVTKGLSINKYEKVLKKISKPNKINNNLYSSLNFKNLYFVNKSIYFELISILYICNIIITPHGGLSHTSSLFNKRLIDLIEINRKSFYNKWKPLGKKTIQHDINDTSQILTTLKRFLKRSIWIINFKSYHFIN